MLRWLGGAVFDHLNRSVSPLISIQAWLLRCKRTMTSPRTLRPGKPTGSTSSMPTKAMKMLVLEVLVVDVLRVVDAEEELQAQEAAPPKSIKPPLGRSL